MVPVPPGPAQGVQGTEEAEAVAIENKDFICFPVHRTVPIADHEQATAPQPAVPRAHPHPAAEGPGAQQGLQWGPVAPSSPLEAANRAGQGGLSLSGGAGGEAAAQGGAPAPLPALHWLWHQVRGNGRAQRQANPEGQSCCSGPTGDGNP